MRFAWIRVLGLVAIVCSLFAPRTARAEADTFGLGNGHTGAVTYTTGTINAYAQVTAIDATKKVLTVSSTTGFTAANGGDLVMVWQQAGGSGTSGSQTAITLTGVGAWEFGRVSAVGGGT